MADPAVEIGTLKDIVFARDGFLIGKFAYEQKRGVFTALGKIMRPERGLAYKLRGHWTENPRFGRQLAFGYYEVLQPKDAEGIFKYLVRVAKWIGPTVAGRIVNAYGENSLEVLRSDPERVAAEIKGITLERAKEIQACLAENEQIEAALVEIEKAARAGRQRSQRPRVRPGQPLGRRRGPEAQGEPVHPDPAERGRVPHGGQDRNRAWVRQQGG